MRRKREQAFTLIEMMVVIVILGILATVVTVKVDQHIRRARTVKAQIQIREFVNAIKLFKMDNSKIPEALEDLVEKTDKHPDGLLPVIPKDPWGNDYDFTEDEEHEYAITSYGADGQEGGEGDDADIISYELEAGGADADEEGGEE
jgi:general secretion pathway protein G